MDSGAVSGRDRKESEQNGLEMGGNSYFEAVLLYGMTAHATPARMADGVEKLFYLYFQKRDFIL